MDGGFWELDGLGDRGEGLALGVVGEVLEDGLLLGDEVGDLLPPSGEVVAAFAVEFGVLDDRRCFWQGRGRDRL